MYNLEFKTSCEHKIDGTILPRFPNGRRAPITPHEEGKGDDEENGENVEELDKASMSQEDITLIATGSAVGFVVISGILVFAFVKRNEANRRREFMENNPIYGDDYYYNPIKRNEEKVEYYDVTKNKVEKHDRII